MGACVCDVGYACTGLLQVGGSRNLDMFDAGSLGLRIDNFLNSLYQLTLIVRRGVLCGYELDSSSRVLSPRTKEAYMNDDREWMETSQRVFSLIEYHADVFSILIISQSLCLALNG